MGTPAAIIEKLYQETARITALPDFRSKLAKQGIETIGNSPAEFAAVVSAETRFWAKVINDAGAKLPE
jgi:tripartite-type tricarboxylate transporter receptor subunit TctC